MGHETNESEQIGFSPPRNEYIGHLHHAHIERVAPSYDLWMRCVTLWIYAKKLVLTYKRITTQSDEQKSAHVRIILHYNGRRLLWFWPLRTSQNCSCVSVCDFCPTQAKNKILAFHCKPQRNLSFGWLHLAAANHKNLRDVKIVNETWNSFIDRIHSTEKQFHPIIIFVQNCICTNKAITATTRDEIEKCLPYVFCQHQAIFQFSWIHLCLGQQCILDGFIGFAFEKNAKQALLDAINWTTN